MIRILLLVAILCVACHDNGADINGAPVPSKIFVSAGLYLNDFPGSGTIMNSGLTIKTADIYDPGYREIKRMVEKTSKGWIITLTGVGEGLADTGWAPVRYADCNVTFEAIEPGSYNVQIINGDIKNFGILTVSEDGVDLNFPTPFELEVLPPNFRRIE